MAPEPLSFSCPVLPEPQAGALPRPGPGALPSFLCLGRRAQALAIARFAVFPFAWPFSDLGVCLLGPLPLVSLEKSCLLSSPLPGALFQGLRRNPGRALCTFGLMPGPLSLPFFPPPLGTLYSLLSEALALTLLLSVTFHL